MDERRDQHVDDGTRAPIVAAASELSDIQKAWAAFVRHVTRTCARCRDIDQTNCADADRLHRAWREQADAALGQMAAPRGPVPEGH